jgi:hypothetical protein
MPELNQYMGFLKEYNKVIWISLPKYFLLPDQFF